MTSPLTHPVIPVPRVADFYHAPDGSIRSREQVKELYDKAVSYWQEAVRKEQQDPLRYGWEPPIWQICDALLGFDWVDEAWAETVRTQLGFEQPVRVLLILGGNRGGKTEYSMKRAQKVLNLNEHARAWLLHQKRQMSVDYHHSGMWRYMPSELRGKDRKERVVYISYKQKTGFSEDKFVLPNGSDCSFLNYSMDRDTAIEGGEVDLYCADELIPPDWVETLHYRIATRQGRGVVTFTPVNGYTATVGLFCDGAEVVLDEPAFLVPRDGGEPDIPRALGFESEAEMNAAHQDKRWSRPHPFFDESGALLPERSVPAGRKFERAPRILKSVDSRLAVVHFHSYDNPYGNPYEVARTLLTKPDAMRLERFYGVANKTVSARFPKFNRTVHVLDADSIPAEGTNYLIIDPAKGRNFFMTWFRVVGQTVYLYREWPSQTYPIPGQGVCGPWALPDGKKLDGKAGPAQNPFGFGLIDYVEEIARLEGWKNREDLLVRLRKAAKKQIGKNGKPEVALESLVFEIETAQRQAIERVELRLIDSRAASEPKLENDRPVTLQSELEDLGLDCGLTPGVAIDEGVELINDALSYDEEAPVGYLNSPDLISMRVRM